MEIAYGFDTDSFLRALCKMCNRQGVPEMMLSDNGTNFVGLNQELCQLKEKLFKDQKFKESLTSKNIEWTFNLPSASHFGGVFEVMIKAAKREILGC